MAALNVLTQNIDKGLRSQQFCDQTATLCRVSSAFNEHPIPTFVNQVVLRLAEAFRDGSNDLRIAIGRILGQCESQLTLAFSSVEIFRRIMTVSHSNDPEARETVLDALKSLSIMDPENKQAHHFIREALVTTHDGEFRAACEAMSQFAKLSPEFAESAVSQISKIITDSAISSDRKVQATLVIARMSANVHSVELVLVLSESLMTWNPEPKVLSALLDATTSLCIETKYAIPRQLDLLLNLLNLRVGNDEKRKQEDPSVNIAITTILTQLKRIANYSTIWSAAQIEKLAAMNLPFVSDTNNVHLRLLADVALKLSSNSLPSHLEPLSKLILSMSSIGSSEDMSLRVRHVQLIISLMKSSKETTLTSSSLFLVLTSVIRTNLQEKLSKRLYKSLGDFLCCDQFLHTDSASVVFEVVHESFTAEPVVNAEQKLQLFCRLSDQLPEFARPLQQFAEDIVENKPSLAAKYPSLLVFLLLAVNTQVNIDKIQRLVANPVRRYEAARMALRNGHAKSVAWPLLETIRTKRMNVMEHDWIIILKHLAAAELNTFDEESIDDAQSHLESAMSLLETANETSRFTDCTRIPLLYVSCVHRTNDLFNQLLLTLTPFVTTLRAALQPGPYFNPTVARRLTTALSGILSEAKTTYEQCSVFCRQTFCADETSRDLLILETERVSVIILFLEVLLTGKSPERAQSLRQLTTRTSSTSMFQKQLEWAMRQVGCLVYDDHPDINTILSFDSLLRHVALLPRYVPRFFFQQPTQLKFKLNISPAGDLQKAAGEATPVRIDGSFMCSEKDAIQSIRITASIAYVVTTLKNRDVVEEVTPNDKNFFHVQFLFTMYQSAEITFRIEFTDTTFHNTWMSPETARMAIDVVPRR